MRGLVFLPDRDVRDGDWHGAFRPEAERLVSVVPGCTLHPVNVAQSDEARRLQVCRALAAAGEAGPLNLVAFIGHGWLDGIQFGFRRKSAPELAAAIATAAAPGAAVVLYACSTAKESDEPTAGTAGGFAEVLAAGLGRCTLPDGSPGTSLHVDAHDRAGHCCSNPYVRRMPAGGGDGWLIDPRSAAWGAWERELHDRSPRSSLRFRYPLMASGEVIAELGRGYGAVRG